MALDGSLHGDTAWCCRTATCGAIANPLILLGLSGGRELLGRSPKEIEEAFRSDPNFRDAVGNLTKKFCDDYNKVKIDMLKPDFDSSEYIVGVSVGFGD